MAAFEGPPPWLLEALQRASDEELPFETRVQAADRAAKLADQYVADIISAGMLFDGRSWTDVGNALGITRQGAFQRFRRKISSTVEDQK